MTSHNSRIFLFFGTFDPLHKGHLAVASGAQSYGEEKGKKQQNADPSAQKPEVWFVLTPQSPTKHHHPLFSTQERQQILRQALLSSPACKLCDIECHMKPPYYTFYTLQRLQAQYPHTHFTLLMGGDQYAHFFQWHRADEMAKQVSLMVYQRNSEVISSSANVTMMENTPRLPYSSSHIRALLGKREDIAREVPSEVYGLILRLWEAKSRSLG